MGQALEAVAAANVVIYSAGDRGGGSRSSAETTAAVPKAAMPAATLALEVASDKGLAKLAVKEVKPLGAVDLASVTMPVLNEVR